MIQTLEIYIFKGKLVIPGAHEPQLQFSHTQHSRGGVGGII